MTSNPVRISSYARMMADLHIQMHKNDARTLLPLRSWLTRCIQEAEALPSDLRDFARSILQELPDGKALCHFDFHPGQIIMSKEGPIVLDWMTAFQGDPLADVARTSILLTMGRTDHLKWLTRVMVGVGRRQMHRAYRKQYLRRNGNSSLGEIKKWMIPIAAARLNEKIGGEEEVLLDFLKDSQKQFRGARHL
jgi:aminoglycoside phosphotransferase (APT) family kinase protein